MFDVIVVGAGPVGLYITKLLEKDLKILLLEKSGDTSNKACSGLISTNIEKFLDINADLIEHKINGAVIHSALGSELKLEKPSAVAYVIDRKKLNQKIMQDLKTRINFRTELKDLKLKKKCVEVLTNKGLFKSKILIAADGANSFVRNFFGEKPKSILSGLVAIKNEKNYSKFVEVFVDKTKIKDGVFWKIPRGKKTEYGAFGTGLNFKKLEEFFKLKNYEKNAGLIPLGLIKTIFERTILIGDAACQVKPWSGGGIIYGFKAAQIAKKVVLNCFEKNVFSEKALQQYDLQWKKELGKYIKIGLILRGFYKRMNNKIIETFFKTAAKIKFLNKLDMDFPNIFFKKKVVSPANQ